ncbi:MAG: YihA family ribosome biogenesis GTP-binding protein [Bacteroidetes bacterium]|nr:YihA family ribosome biogenesis GTP-binding protein [Bacteroidota bacterium]
MLITKAVYSISNPHVKNCPKPDRPEYAFIGRSNVGKSSLINMLCGQQKLAKTSGTPGKTQLINHFEIESRDGAKQPLSKWYLVDLPGYGYAKVAQNKRNEWELMIRDYLLKRKNLLQVFVLIDSRHLPQKIDREFVDNLLNAQIPFSLVFTKSDKEKPAVVKRHVQAFLETLREHWQFLPQTFVTSAINHSGRDEILSLINNFNKSFTSGHS